MPLTQQSQSNKTSPMMAASKRPSSFKSICKYSICILLIIISTQQFNCQNYKHTKCERERQQVRQQRQFNQQANSRSSQASNSQQNLPLNNLSNQPDVEHEEFSLSLGAGPNSQTQNHNYTLLPPSPQQSNDQLNNQTNSQQPSITTPALPGDSISSPPALTQTATTTLSMISKAPSSGSSNVLETQSTTTGPAPLQENSLFATSIRGSSHMARRLDEQPTESSGRSQPVSSSPSSISIITPLHGPPAQPHHTSTVSASIGGASSDSQAMMKPIFVVGNPISERDYSASTSSLFELNSMQIGGYQNSFSLDQASKATKSPVEQQQQVEQPKPISTKALEAAHLQGPTGRSEKSAEVQEAINGTNQFMGEGMSGPPLVYSDGLLGSVQVPQEQQQLANGSAQLSPRLFQSGGSGAAVLGNNPRRPSLPPPVNQANAASGFRSPLSASGPLIGGGTPQQTSTTILLQPPINNNLPQPTSFYQTSAPYAGTMVPMGANSLLNSQQSLYNKPAFVISQQQGGAIQQSAPNQQQIISAVASQQVPPSSSSAPVSSTGGYSGRRPLNITRVEHISAECSNDLIRAVIVFNGTFKGIIYSSGYVNDPTCLYVNGTGSTRYEFSIRLNQCGTLGRQELHQPTVPGEARRRDQVMWNTLSIQYNSIIEQEWDEHFRVSCEYGSDFWKTVSFSPFNVETNTGSPVVFTINPPQCQMDVLLGHGIGPKIVDGPVTVGDPLTLLIHMKSEKAGYDILVKNCVAHNGGKQRMQLIDSNGCVVNERFISPFRGTYNDNDLRHVTLYAYLKAFRFTGSPVLYLECEIHMCQSACPPQMCYWRRLSKRSVDEFEYEYTTNSSSQNDKRLAGSDSSIETPIISDSLNLFKALQVRQESEPTKAKQHMREIHAEDDEALLICYGHTEVLLFLSTIASLLILVISIAVVFCLKIRKLTRNQFKHNRIVASGSISPSLLSISDAISSAGSILSGAGYVNINSSSNKRPPPALYINRNAYLH